MRFFLTPTEVHSHEIGSEKHFLLSYNRGRNRTREVKLCPKVIATHYDQNLNSFSTDVLDKTFSY